MRAIAGRDRRIMTSAAEVATEEHSVDGGAKSRVELLLAESQNAMTTCCISNSRQLVKLSKRELLLPCVKLSRHDHVFVDEFSCIGCKNCANVCSKVFEIEEDFGRARVYCQTGNEELIHDAIDSCPVDCIHWTSPAQRHSLRMKCAE